MKEYSNKKFSRRKFLFLLGFAGLGTLTYSIGNLTSFFVNLSNQKSGEWLDRYFSNLFGDKRSVKMTGNLYLQHRPDENDKAFLTKKLCSPKENYFRDLVDQGKYDPLNKHILKNHLTDFEQGNVVNIDGWIISQTEGRVYALATLVWNRQPLIFRSSKYRHRL